MRKLLLLLFCLVTLVSVQAQKTINDPNAEVRQVGSFCGLQISNAFQVTIIQGDTEAVVVSASDKEDVQDIITEVKDGILRINIKSKNSWFPRSRKLRAYVSVKCLRSIRAGGASNIRVEGDLKVPELTIGLSGASDMKGRIFVNGNLKIELSGASDLDLTGTAAHTVIDASGASDMDGYAFSTQTCEAEGSGASSIQLTVDREVNARLSGASSMRYKGDAVIKNINTSGASKISRKA
jgi:hypothetical protein